MFNKIIGNVMAKSPLVHNITNYVTVNDCANVVLASGGSPLMADDIDEVVEIVSISSALYINVGTLNKRTIASMVAAGQAANAKGIPVILDPVGMGASTLRNETVNKLIEAIEFSVIKGNMSEIKAMYMNSKHAGGVDVAEEDEIKVDQLSETVEFAKKVAKKMACIIAITGPIDIVTDGEKAATIQNGHPMMARVTGTGCVTGSLIATFSGANPSEIFDATVSGLVMMGLAGERAYDKVSNMGEGTASFKRYLIDSISLLDASHMTRGGNYEIR